MFNKSFEELTVNELREIYHGLKNFSESLESWLDYMGRRTQEYYDSDWNEDKGINKIIYYDYKGGKSAVELVKEDFEKEFVKCL